MELLSFHAVSVQEEGSMYEALRLTSQEEFVYGK